MAKQTKRKRPDSSVKRVKIYASFFFMLDLADSYELEKLNDNAVKLKYRIDEHETLIVAHGMPELMQHLGEWIVRLPSCVLDEREKKVKQFNKDMEA